MTIGIDIRPLMTAPRTGVGEYTFELLDAIFRLDRDNQYFLFYNSGRDVSANIPEWNFPNVKIIGSHLSNKFFNSSLGLFGRPKLDKMVGKKIDIWFAPNLNFTALSRGTKYIITIHDLSFDFFPEFSTLKQRLWHRAVRPKTQCQRANFILTPSQNTKRDIVDYYGISPDKIKVIYPGVNSVPAHHVILSETKNLTTATDKDPSADGLRMTRRSELVQKYNLPEKFILFLGTVEPRKNIIGLIDAFENLREKYPVTEHLVIAGAPGWKNEEIYARAQKSAYAEKIHFINFISPEEKPALYAASSVFVYPSFYEGFGFPVLEAMAAGTPVITSNRSSLPEIAGSAAYLIDPTRPEQITLAMNELLTKTELRTWHKQKGLEQVEKFSWETAAREWINTIKTL